MRTDRTNLSFTSNGYTSTYHLYAGGLDWSKSVGLLIYTDGSGEFGLKNPKSSYLLAGSDGMIAVAKKHNMYCSHHYHQIRIARWGWFLLVYG